MPSSSSRILLVGAGPGDPNLMTQAARDACRSADVIYYDALVAPSILKLFPGKKLIFAGKRGGKPSISQDRITRQLILAARRNRRVVRLKGGDPFLFGRGGEEAVAIRKSGISISVIPGISSAQAAAAYAGFPLTDRRHASSVVFLTGTSAPGVQGVRHPDFRSLVKLGGTWVFFMGFRGLSKIVSKLIRSGANPSLPAAVISRASTPQQRVVVSTLDSIAASCARAGLESPALAVIGHVVSLRPRPLRSCPALVMRPRDQSGQLSDLLRRRGCVVQETPSLIIVPIRSNPALRRSTRILDQYDWILLTSGNAVRLMKSVLTDPRRRARIAAVGPGTAACLKAIGCRSDLSPESDFHAEGLAAVFLRSVRSSQRIFFPQAAGGRAELCHVLAKAGHRVDVVPIYKTAPIRSSVPRIRKWVGSVNRGVVPLTSASMSAHFSRAVSGLRIDHLKLVTMGPVTTAAATEKGLAVAAESPRATLKDLVDTLETVA